MKNTVFAKLTSLMLALLMLFTLCTGCTKDNISDAETTDPLPVNQTQTDPIAESAESPVTSGSEIEYNPGVVLIKCENGLDEALLEGIEYESVEPLYVGSTWYLLKLSDPAKTEEAVNALNELGCFDGVDYDYIMKSDGHDVSGNPDFEKSKHFGPHGIQQGWQHINDHGRHPGGNADVVVAVIDTGVDYYHLDLRNNIWTNPMEIPDNGIDDDGNGYIDDIYGWNCVGDNNEPLDDNGHGTHVAGIIAAENNSIGGVGVAYNCRIMVLKAGNSSGYFNNSDIAEAVQYAYMNGASVINMSFGGSMISVAAEEALQIAYTNCVLVAAAGNDGLCNNLSHYAEHDVGISYPAALPYVIGVMSVTSDGSAVSEFSNFDDTPYDSVEYEVYAVGETIPSTWPGNKYATLQGTSMAAPSVSGIAALLRSYYSDRDMYSTKFIQSQIVNTGTLYPWNNITQKVDEDHSITNIYEALTQLPKPNVKLYDYYVDDSYEINMNTNNGNGVVDAGETVRLYVSLHNRGGIASNVVVTADVNRLDSTLTDPYFTIVNPVMNLSDIGTYSVRESGDQYFEIIVSPDCPNDYLSMINIHYNYTNGLDVNDYTTYFDDNKQKAHFDVSSGYHLPSIISEDTVYTADRLYIVGDDVTIPTGVTVTFLEGCEIQFYTDKEYYNSPKITVYGTLNLFGTKDNMINVHPAERYYGFACCFVNEGNINIDYSRIANPDIYDLDYPTVRSGIITNSYIANESDHYYDYIHKYVNGNIQNGGGLSLAMISDSYIDSQCMSFTIDDMHGCLVNIYKAHTSDLAIFAKFDNNTVYMVGPCNGQLVYNCDKLYAGISVSNNKFIATEENADSIVPISVKHPEVFINNYFSDYYRAYASQSIKDFIGSDGIPIVDIYDSCSDETLLYPHVTNVQIFNTDGEEIHTVGTEEVTVRVTFNRPMDVTQNTVVTFGSIEPYADYAIIGGYISDTVWEGRYTVKAQNENGLQMLKVENACAADDRTKTVHGDIMLHEFNIDTASALSMNLFAEPLANGINLTWMQDDYNTLMGYNIYRSEDKDGNFVKINPTILLSTDGSFLDTNAEPGEEYWYTFTVVLSDFTESAPAGKVKCIAMDTLEPNIYHTPVNMGYQNNNLVISCTANDNIKVAGVTLYYRTVGDSLWKSLAMTPAGDKYSATVFGSDLTVAGLEYYIEATDGYNYIAKGSMDVPYTVVIKDASVLTRIGDIDGDGVVTTKDALMIMQAINEDILLTDDQFKRADLNEDEILSSSEALRILQYINGNVATLEM